MKKKLRIGCLVSGGGTNLQAIIDACADHTIHGKVVFVGSDNSNAFGLTRAKEQRISTVVVDYEAILRQYHQNPKSVRVPPDFSLDAVLARQSILPKDAPVEKIKSFLVPRAVAEAELLEKIKPFPFDLLVLAGFMRILTPYFIDRVNTDPENLRIMNIHPALLPAFPGTDGYGDTFRYGCKVAGCTVHFIDYGEDTGPIIAQRAFSIQEKDTLEKVREKGLRLEWKLYPECIRLFSENRLRVVRNTVLLSNGQSMIKSAVRILPPVDS
ncbi:MAG: phosphoribosylglycinamide formyltransferase [Thermodesulfobacteriota bacterium]